MKRRLRRRYGLSKRARKRASIGRTTHTIHNVNPGDKSWTRHNYILWFGAGTYLRVWANGIESALDEAGDWLSDHKPGLLVDEATLKEEYDRAIAEGKSEEEAWEAAETDTTPAGGYCQRVNSDEWGIVAEDPTREQVLQLQGRR